MVIFNSYVCQCLSLPEGRNIFPASKIERNRVQVTSRAEDQKLLRLQVEEVVSSAERERGWLMVDGWLVPTMGRTENPWFMDVNGDLFYGIIWVYMGLYGFYNIYMGE